MRFEFDCPHQSSRAYALVVDLIQALRRELVHVLLYLPVCVEISDMLIDLFPCFRIRKCYTGACNINLILLDASNISVCLNLKF